MFSQVFISKEKLLVYVITTIAESFDSWENCTRGNKADLMIPNNIYNNTYYRHVLLSVYRMGIIVIIFTSFFLSQAESCQFLSSL